MKKNKFSLMGKIVTVNQIYEKAIKQQKNEGKEIITNFWDIKNISPRAGWVTGYRFIYEGIYHPGQTKQGMNGWDDYEEPHLEITKTIPCLLVVFYPTYNSVRVPINAVVEGGIPSPTNYPWEEQDKESLRKECKLWPRDKKGRWIKETL